MKVVGVCRYVGGSTLDRPIAIEAAVAAVALTAASFAVGAAGCCCRSVMWGWASDRLPCSLLVFFGVGRTSGVVCHWGECPERHWAHSSLPWFWATSCCDEATAMWACELDVTEVNVSTDC